MIHGICGNVCIQFYRIPKVFKTVCDLNFDSIRKNDHRMFNALATGNLWHAFYIYTCNTILPPKKIFAFNQ